jgi:hypothetical protein
MMAAKSKPKVQTKERFNDTLVVPSNPFDDYYVDSDFDLEMESMAGFPQAKFSNNDLEALRHALSPSST